MSWVVNSGHVNIINLMMLVAEWSQKILKKFGENGIADRTPEMLIQWAFPALFYGVWL